MDVHVAIEGDADGGEGNSSVCFMGGMLEQSGDEKVTYEGGSRRCMVVKEVQRMVMRLWVVICQSTKYGTIEVQQANVNAS